MSSNTVLVVFPILDWLPGLRESCGGGVQNKNVTTQFQVTVNQAFPSSGLVAAKVCS